jgi:hypothetical protein
VSRIDDAERQAAKVAERLALQKRQEEQRTKERGQAETAFSRLIQKGQGEKDGQARVAQERAGEQARRSRDRGDDTTEAAGLVESLLAQSAEDRQGQQRGGERRLSSSFGERIKQAYAGEGERMGEGKTADQGRESMTARGRNTDQRTHETRAESRKLDAAHTRESLEERGEATGKGAQGQKGKGGALRTERDAGGGGGQKGSGKDSKDGGSEVGGSFRFNPALMAPVPIAKPKESSGSERLRALANEIAQKIVARVRLGTNAVGQAEFQIDLRSEVLSGLSIKVSSSNGKIRAVFSGKDREVLKLLGEHADSLKQALGGRGLSLEEMKIEERA